MSFFSKRFGPVSDKAAGGELVFNSSKTCPECGSKLATRKDELSESRSAPSDGDSRSSSLRSEDAKWRCPNLDCPVRVRERIEHWCSAGAMDIPSVDEALVAQLVKQGLVRDVAEMYSVKLIEVAALEGRDKQFAKSLIEQLAASKSREGWRVLYGLGIPQVDTESAKQLSCKLGAVDDILAAGPERLLKQAGVSESVARSIAQWYGDSVNRRLVRRLQRAGVDFKTDGFSPPRSCPSSSER